MPLTAKSGDQCLRLTSPARDPYIFIQARNRHLLHMTGAQKEGRAICAISAKPKGQIRAVASLLRD